MSSLHCTICIWVGLGNSLLLPSSAHILVGRLCNYQTPCHHYWRGMGTRHLAITNGEGWVPHTWSSLMEFPSFRITCTKVHVCLLRFVRTPALVCVCALVCVYTKKGPSHHLMKKLIHCGKRTVICYVIACAAY